MAGPPKSNSHQDLLGSPPWGIGSRDEVAKPARFPATPAVVNGVFLQIHHYKSHFARF
jgi:hypothetical protein